MDEAVKSKRYGTLAEAMARYSLGRRATENLAKEARAKSKIGSRAVYSFAKMDKLIDAKASGE